MISTCKIVKRGFYSTDSAPPEAYAMLKAYNVAISPFLETLVCERAVFGAPEVMHIT
jgi:hypothetical protein